MIQIEAIEQSDKGKQKLTFDNGRSFILYQNEIKPYELKEKMTISDELYEELLYQIIGKRAKKRAMHLLERQERTEYQLKEKLRQNQYPKEAIEEAIAYVKKYHYVDDMRYACTFIQCQREKRSKRRIQQDLMKKGIASDIIEAAFSEEGVEDETQAIQRLLKKKGYSEEISHEDACKIYQFLLRKGYNSADIRHAMKW